jgi:hypothetical protein
MLISLLTAKENSFPSHQRQKEINRKLKNNYHYKNTQPIYNQKNWIKISKLSTQVHLKVSKFKKFQTHIKVREQLWEGK